MPLVSGTWLHVYTTTWSSSIPKLHIYFEPAVTLRTYVRSSDQEDCCCSVVVTAAVFRYLKHAATPAGYERVATHHLHHHQQHHQFVVQSYFTYHAHTILIGNPIKCNMVARDSIFHPGVLRETRRCISEHLLLSVRKGLLDFPPILVGGEIFPYLWRVSIHVAWIPVNERTDTWHHYRQKYKDSWVHIWRRQCH